VDTAVAGSAPDLASRLAAVKDRIAAAARRSGRDPSAVTLVAVSKTVPAERIRDALDAGVTDLGENRVQEAEAKAPLLPRETRWHLIGHLQSNKINKALELFCLIHSIDRVDLGLAVAARAARRGTTIPVLLQVNLAEKETQFGLGAADAGPAARTLAGAGGLALEGLMCIAPEADDPEATRPTFRRLATLFGELEPELRRAGHPWRHLSMGMSHDHLVAVEEGATLVRVGRAIFGDRPAPAAPAPA
jgi:pyridoxal phosphate enzyme (YggS family)